MTNKPDSGIDVAELARLVSVHRNQIGHYTGFKFVHALEQHFAALATPGPAPAHPDDAAAAAEREAALVAKLAATHDEYQQAAVDAVALLGEAAEREAALVRERERLRKSLDTAMASRLEYRRLWEESQRKLDEQQTK